MPLFNKFPYTNFHELNLNWILEQIPILKKYRDETEELRDDTKVLHYDTKVLYDNTKVLHDNVVEQHKEITAEITQGKKDISDLTNTGKAEITELTNNSKQDIVDTTTEGKNELNSIITTGTNQLDTLIDTGKADIKSLTDSGKSTIETATTTGKAEITNTVTDGKAQITTAKDEALDAIGTAKDSATTTIKNLESSATSAITAKGDLYLHQIADEGKKQTDSVTSEGSTQITNITKLGDTYKTEMTTLKNDAQTSADNAKASETKAQEYAESAKTLKPMYWGGDIDNLHNTTNVLGDCLNFANLQSTSRYSNFRILTNASYSPDASKEWQCKISFSSDSSMDLLAWSADGEMYIGSLTHPYNNINWSKTVNLDEIRAEFTTDIAELEKKAWTLNENTTPLLDDTNLTIEDVFDQKLPSFYISPKSKYKVKTLDKFMRASVVHGNAKIYVAYINNNEALWLCPQFNAYATATKGSPAILWYFSRTQNIAEWTYKFKKPTMKVGNDILEFTNNCDYNPNSCEYKVNVSFQGVEATNKMYKIILDSELTFLRNTGDIPAYIVARDDTTSTIISVVITHSPTDILELWVTISEADKASIVGKTCFLAVSLW